MPKVQRTPEEINAEEDARLLLVYFWSTLHGCIAGLTNTLLTYMHETPASLKDWILNLIYDTFVREVRSRSMRNVRRIRGGKG